MAMTAALVALTEAGAALARRIQEHLPGALIHGLEGRVASPDVAFTSAATHLQHLFAAGHPIVGICAAGILVRTLAPCLADKHADPPVLAVAEDGSTVVPLLGGHRGANELARRIADATHGVAAITTASDVALGIALDVPPPGWRIADMAAVRPLAAAALAGQPVALKVEAGAAGWLRDSGLRFSADAEHAIRVTYRAADGDARTLTYHPPVLAVGVGCERGTSPEELSDLVRKTLQQFDLAPGAVACVASIDLKMDEPAINAVGDMLGVPTRFFAAERLACEESRLATPSAYVRAAVGVAGVAEAAALACVGADGRLLVAKQKSRRATCAVALASADIDPHALGQARGHLAIVGIGPGTSAWRTPEASAALTAATDIVGYGLYLDLLGDAIRGKRRHESGLGDEEGRVRRALDLAAAGNRVALVSSGDAGIYGLATLAFELVARGDDPAWGRIAVTVCPGLSALQAAAARAGAPLGHDFCAISLSDLLTPWPDIERRLRAVASADFVVALYNPASLRRRSQLARAKAILLEHRPPGTPVVIARNLGRDGETVSIVALGELDETRIDMLTVLLIGSSRTRTVDAAGARWVFTPRGYADKAPARRTEPA